MNIFLLVLITLVSIIGFVWVLFRNKLLNDAQSKLLMRILFYPVLPIVYIKNTYIVGWYHRIEDNLYLGGLPFRNWNSVDDLISKIGMTHVINLCDEFNENTEKYALRNIQQLYIPLCDYSQPSHTQLLEAIRFLHLHTQNPHHTIYVHCRAGVGRSATVVLCWLLYKYRDWTPESALLFLKKKRKVADNLHHRACVKNFYQALARGEVDQFLKSF